MEVAKILNLLPLAFYPSEYYLKPKCISKADFESKVYIL